MIHRLLLSAVAIATFAAGSALHACGFAELAGKVVTMHDDAAQSRFIILVRLENTRKTPEGGLSDFAITRTIKADPIIGDRKSIVLPRYIDTSNTKGPIEYVVFGDIWKGQLDYFRGIRTNPTIIEYLEGLIRIVVKDRNRVMRYCFDYLDSADPDVARDAFQQFEKSTDPEIRDAGRKLAPAKLRLWLKDEKTDKDKLRLYGFLLANCGDQGDTDLLRSVIDRAISSKTTNFDGVLTGYVLLDRDNGWKRVRELLKQRDEGTFSVRWSAFRAVRYLRTNEPKMIAKDESLAALVDSLAPDFADLTINYLRESNCWALTPQIIALYDPKRTNNITRHAIIRYAFECSTVECRRLLATARTQDTENFKDAEEAWNSR